MSKEYIERDSAGYPHKVSESAAPAQPGPPSGTCDQKYPKYPHTIGPHEKDAGCLNWKPAAPSPVLTPSAERLQSATDDAFGLAADMKRRHKQQLDYEEAERSVLPVPPPRNQLAKILWDSEIAESNYRGEVKDWAQWPDDFEIQPYCRSTLRQADFILERLRSSSPAVAPTKDINEIAEKIADELCTGAQSKLRMKEVIRKHFESAPAVAGRTQGDTRESFEKWAGDDAGLDLTVGYSQGEWYDNLYQDRATSAAANSWHAALRESAREAPSNKSGRFVESDQEKIWQLVEQWAEVWQADRAKFATQFPAWMVAAATEIFAHDYCDAWNYNEYVSAVCVLLNRHFERESSPEAPSHIECEGCGRSGPLSYVGRTYTPKTSPEAEICGEWGYANNDRAQCQLPKRHEGGCHWEFLENRADAMRAPAVTKEK